MSGEPTSALRTPIMTALNLATFALDTGLLVLIWLVQLVIYPSFRVVEAGDFRSWHAQYTRRMGWVVIPLMFGQLGCHAALAWGSPTCPAVLLALAGVIAAWVLTFVKAVPLHRQLGRLGRDANAIDRLVRVNAWRTAAWTLTWAVTGTRLGMATFSD